MIEIQNFDNYLFRCSSLSKIIPNQKTKALTETIKKEIRKLFVEEVTNTRKQIHSKYLDKGVACEPLSTRILQDALYPTEVLNAKKYRGHNDYITGEPDIIIDGYVYDLKNAWDLFTFTEASLTEAYEWQLIGYMWIFNLKKGRLFYTINDLPKFLLDKELNNLLYSKEHNFNGPLDPLYFQACDELRERNSYGHLDLSERFKLWDVEYSEEKIEIIKDSVLKARSYMNDLLVEHKEHIEKNKKLMELARS